MSPEHGAAYAVLGGRLAEVPRRGGFELQHAGVARGVVRDGDGAHLG